MADFESIIRDYCGEDGSVPAGAIAKLTKAIRETVGNEFVEKTRYKAKLEEIDTLKAEKQTAEDSVSTAEKWKSKYDALKADFDSYKGEVTAKETRSTKEKALRELIDRIGIKNHVDRIVKYYNIDGITLDESGKIVDPDKHEKSIKNEWNDHISTSVQRGTTPETPPANSGGTSMTRDEIMKIKDTGKRQAAIAENHELFGF